MDRGVNRDLMEALRTAHASSKPHGVSSRPAAMPSISFVKPSPSASESDLADIDKVSTTATKSPIEDDESSQWRPRLRKAQPLVKSNLPHGATKQNRSNGAKRLVHFAGNHLKGILHKLAKAPDRVEEKLNGASSAPFTQPASSDPTELRNILSDESSTNPRTPFSPKTDMLSDDASSNMWSRSLPTRGASSTPEFETDKFLTGSASNGDLSKVAGERSTRLSLLKELTIDTNVLGATAIHG